MTKLLITQAFLLGTAWAQAPAIAPDGIVDAASRMAPSLPGAKLAPGSKVRIPGVRLVASGSEVLIQLEAGQWRKVIHPDFANAELLEATLPVDTPTGTVKIWVSNAEGASRAQEIRVEASHPAIFTLNGEGWGPAIRDTVHPGDRVSLRINGLNGKIPKLFVAGKLAEIRQTKPGEVMFTVPKESATGCWTPVWTESASGTLSNFVSIPVANPGEPCEEARGWPLRTMAPGKRTALVTLQRFAVDMELVPGHPVKFAYDSAAASFFRTDAGKLLPYQILPPKGTCTAFTGTFLFASLRFFESVLSFRDFLGGENLPLDAASAVQIYEDAPEEGHSAPLARSGTGEYSALLGGFSPTGVLPLFFRSGKYHAAVQGTSQMEGFRQNFEIGPPLEWTNGSPATEVDRSRGILVQWRERTPGRQVAVLAFSADQSTGGAGAALCLASPGDSQMRIPPYALANLPPTRPSANLPLRFLVLLSMPASSDVLVKPEGLDEIRAAFLDIQITSVSFR